MDGLKKFGRNSQKMFQRLVKSANSREKITFTTRIENETRYITWNIENFESTPLKLGEYHESPEFITGFQYCTKWRLRVYPRGKKSPGTIGFYIYKQSPSEKVNLGFDIQLGSLEDAEQKMLSVVKEENILMTSEEVESGEDVDFLQFPGELPQWEEQFTIHKAKRTLSCKSIKIFCILNVSYFDDTLDYDEKSSSGFSADSTLSEDLREIYTNGKFSDVLFQVGQKQIPAHKAILAARSQYFAAMFEHPMEESQTNVVNVEDIELPAFKDFLHYIYSGKIENLTVDRAIALYSVADKYGMDELRKLCTRVILVNVCVDNVCKIAVLGDHHSDPQLKSAASHVFRKFKHQIFQRKDWKRLINERQHLVSEILSDVSSDLRSKC